jgi:hypothetical protein
MKNYLASPSRYHFLGNNHLGIIAAIFGSSGVPHFRTILSLQLLVFLACLGCSKRDAKTSSSQPPVASERAAATSATAQPPAVRPSQAALQGAVFEFTGEVARGHGFEKSVAGGLAFRLEADAGSDSGWEIRLAPGAEPSSASMDCIGAVSAPLHGDDHLSIQSPGLDKDRDESQWKKREFDFVPTPAECKKAWDLANEAHYPSKLTDKQREEAETKLGKVSTTHGTFEITDLRLGPSAGKDAPAQIEWLKFAVRLQFPATSGMSASSATTSDRAAKSIRDVDVENHVLTHYRELDPNLESLKEQCGEGQDAIQSVGIQYGDADGDG